MKYAHLADLHLGSWRDQKMRDLSTKAFLQAIDDCVRREVDFILFAGDLFNTSIPSMDTMKIVTRKLRELQGKNIPVYVIAGSHDFSPSGKTMVEVLEEAGLIVNVCKGSVNQETKELQLRFTVDERTGVKITGMLGRKGQLDQKFYENLDRKSLEEEQGYKIFMFHTTVAELLPKDLAFIDSQPLSFFPKNFAYYAGGHIHNPKLIREEGYGVATYPGALFPNNFAEFEKFGKGGFYVVSVVNGMQQEEWVPLEVVKHRKVEMNCTGKSPEIVVFDVLSSMRDEDLTNTVVTLRLKGMLQSGKVSEVNFKQIMERLYSQGAYFVMKNTAKLVSEEFEEISLPEMRPELVEEAVIKEHLQQLKTFNAETEMRLAKSLLQVLNTTKKEGETVTDFQKRIESDVSGILELEKK